ncbi:collagen triple helix repeat motif-containing protein [Catovirus CTV1]|uniref:Collagen triple helix repeat motif-containing protein n=1 Tax=Catovirus CTV1 TaxID=1977631 RepID=A0A1V0SAE9_9VIRU|nr:collagen triple helix repeat motif-containing protein [Catovirus CTV1]
MGKCCVEKKYDSDSDDDRKICCVRGKRGHRGHRGHEGPTGATGPAGPIGPTGPSGNTVLDYVNGTVFIVNPIPDQGFIGNEGLENYELAGSLTNSVNISNGTFTAPTNGIYSLSYSVAYTESPEGSPNGERLIDLVVNDDATTTAQYTSVYKVESAINRVPLTVLSIATDLPMIAGDTANLFVYYNLADTQLPLESITVTFNIVRLSTQLPITPFVNKKKQLKSNSSLFIKKLIDKSKTNKKVIKQVKK